MTLKISMLRRLGFAAVALAAIAGHADADDLALHVGQRAAGLADVLRAADFGYLGAQACSGELAAVSGCTRGQDVLVFQPVAPGRTGRLYVSVADGRIAAVTAALGYVAYSDG